MEPIKKRYIVDEENRRVAVQIDVETFAKIEEVLENHALYQLMQATDDDELLDMVDAMRCFRKFTSPGGSML
ncbi:MAG: hypothetical protein R3247_01800 [Rhodothermales bacterium]|nr:hypothetical protein [Rhodothermales bacterium]